MKKLILVFVIAGILIGCEHHQTVEEGQHWMEVVDNGMGTRFQYVVFRHRATGVCYLINSNGICALMDANGKPYTVKTATELMEGQTITQAERQSPDIYDDIFWDEGEEPVIPDKPDDPDTPDPDSEIETGGPDDILLDDEPPEE